MRDFGVYSFIIVDYHGFFDISSESIQVLGVDPILLNIRHVLRINNDTDRVY